jgi:hypothetical protein
VAVVIPLKLVYTPVDATVTAIHNYQGGDQPRLSQNTQNPLSSSPLREQLYHRSCSNKHTQILFLMRWRMKNLPNTEQDSQEFGASAGAY